MRRAEVRATSEGGVTRLATTDGDGRFELRDLPAGRFRLSVSKSGFVPLQYGQRRPFEAAREIDLEEGERFTADVTLPRGGAIAGRVYDGFGEPVSGVRVNTMRARMVQGRRRLQAVGSGDETDDTGAFRLYGLSPGEYYVVARAGDVRDRVRGGVPIYFPGTVDFSQAQRLTVETGAEAVAVFQLVPVRTARVSGTVLNSAGLPIDAMVNLSSEAVGLGYVNAAAGDPPLMISGHADAQADGEFVIEGVPPGPYSLRVTVFGGSDLSHESASVPIVIANEDIAGITVTTSRGGSISGTFVRDAGVAQALPANLGVAVRGDGMGMQQRGSNTFRLAGVAGPVRLAVEGLPDDWAVKAIVVNGTDVTDSPIELKGDQDAAVRIILTTRITELSGVVATSDRSRDFTVVVFSEDSTKWTYPSRYARTVRTDEQGRFRIAGLPGDERYLAVALDDLEDGEGDDPDFLERIRERATSVSLTESERKAIELRPIRR